MNTNTMIETRQTSSFRQILRDAFGFILHTSFQVRRADRVVLAVPTWIALVLVLTFWKVAVPVMVIALFLGVRYSFSGRDVADTVNDFCKKAGSFAEGVKSGLKKEEKAEA